MIDLETLQARCKSIQNLLPANPRRSSLSLSSTGPRVKCPVTALDRADFPEGVRIGPDGLFKTLGLLSTWISPISSRPTDARRIVGTTA